MGNAGKNKDYHFLGELSQLDGPSGFERHVAEAVGAYVRPFVDNLCTDKMGSLVFTRNGPAGGPTVLVPAHMDEVGFVITTISEDGFLTFSPLGGWADSVLAGQRVKIMSRSGDVTGVIVPPPPIAPDQKQAKGSVLDSMFIDIAASNREEAQEVGIRPGDPVVPESRYLTVERPSFKDGKKSGARTLAFGKAFDDRAGVFLAAELVRVMAQEGIEHPNRLVGAATVQEEVGPRGALTVANMVRPDVALVLDVDISGDVPGMIPAQAPTRMGEGVSITVWDGGTIPNQPLKELCIDICEERGIPYQLSHSKSWTDAAAIHMSDIGVPSIVLGPPVRHIHTHVGIMDLADLDATLALLIELVKKLDRKTVDSLTSIGGLKCGL